MINYSADMSVGILGSLFYGETSVRTLNNPWLLPTDFLDVFFYSADTSVGILDLFCGKTTVRIP